MTTTLVICLPIAELTVELDGKGGGKVTSYLYEWLTADDENEEAQTFYKGVADGLEAMILGHACAGIDVASPEYVAGLERVLAYYGEGL